MSTRQRRAGSTFRSRAISRALAAVSLLPPCGKAVHTSGKRQGEAVENDAQNEEVQNEEVRISLAVFPVRAVHRHHQLFVGQQRQEQLQKDIRVKLGVVQTTLDPAQLVRTVRLTGQMQGKTSVLGRASSNQGRDDIDPALQGISAQERHLLFEQLAEPGRIDASGIRKRHTPWMPLFLFLRLHRDRIALLDLSRRHPTQVVGY